MSGVIPGCRAVIVIHKKGPSSLRVNFDLPSERERVVVIVGHRQERRLCLHAVHVAGCRVLKHFIQATDALKIPSSDVEKWAGSFSK